MSPLQGGQFETNDPKEDDLKKSKDQMVLAIGSDAIFQESERATNSKSTKTTKNGMLEKVIKD